MNINRKIKLKFMRRSYLALFIFYIVCSLDLTAQNKISFNKDWEFQRLDEKQKNVEIKNQGTDWNSQFNIQHVEENNGALAIHSDTLSSEFEKLSSGYWENVNLPHTSYIEPLVVLTPWQGICYYRKRFDISSKDIDKEIWLEFEGAMHLADVWINGRHICQHVGGYTPFVLNLTGMVRTSNNEILVRLDNRNNPLIPPGKPQNTLDFCYYSGLYRDVNLIIKNEPIHISHPIMANEVAGGGIFVTYPEVSDKRAVIEVKTHIVNKLNISKEVSVRHKLYEWSNGKKKSKEVVSYEKTIKLDRNSSKHQIQQIELYSPHLWYPDSPSLYVLCTEILDGKKVLDIEKTRIGIRRIEMSRKKGFLINGKPLILEGTNRHMEYPYVGNAISDQAQYRDMYQIRMNGFNIVRLGHYPQDPSVLDACDELGLLVIEPIPGWQFYNKNNTFINNTFQDIRDMIRRDRNHPSVVMWETTLNESWPPKEWKDSAVGIGHEEYPNDQCFTSGDSYGYNGFDVCYNDWEEGFNRPNNTDKPGFIREYYDYEFGGHYSTTRISRKDGDYALVQNAWNAQWSHNRYRSYYPWTMGGAIWSMYDYNRGCCDNICYSGLADVFRIPKFSLSYFRSQIPYGSYTPEGTMPYEVFVNSHWLKSSSDTVLVYGNVDEVELFLNGRSVCRQKPDNKSTTKEYVSRPDGGNADNINYPPFTFFGIGWESGELKAVGYKNGVPVAEHTVRTPENVYNLEIDYFESGKPASKNDLLIVYVNLKDKNGTSCFYENGRKVKLEVLSGGKIYGPSEIKAEAGIASFLVKTGDEKILSMKAYSEQLETNYKLKLR